VKSELNSKSTNLKENAENSSQFLSSEQSSEPDSLDVVLNITGVKKYGKTLEAIQFEFWIKGALVTVEICVLCDC